MRAFLITTCMCQVALFTIAWLSLGYAATMAAMNTLVLAVLICVPPIVGTCGAALLMRALRPCRILKAKPFFDYRPALAAVAASFLTVILTSVALVLLDHWLNDALILGLAAFVASLLVLSLSATLRPGHCLKCDYDLRGGQSGNRCPECGLPFDGRVVLPV